MCANKNSVNLEWKTFKFTLPMDHGIMPKEPCVITQKYLSVQIFLEKSKFVLFAHTQSHIQAIKLRDLLKLKCL